MAQLLQTNSSSQGNSDCGNKICRFLLRKGYCYMVNDLRDYIPECVHCHEDLREIPATGMSLFYCKSPDCSYFKRLVMTRKKNRIQLSGKHADRQTIASVKQTLPDPNHYCLSCGKPIYSDYQYSYCERCFYNYKKTSYQSYYRNDYNDYYNNNNLYQYDDYNNYHNPNNYGYANNHYNAYRAFPNRWRGSC